MANDTIYPFGTNGNLPANIGIIDDLVTGGADKALAAEQGKVLNEKFGTLDSIGKIDDVTSAAISSVDGSVITVSTSSAYVRSFPHDGSACAGYVSGRIGTLADTCMVAFYGDNDAYIGHLIEPGEAGANVANQYIPIPGGTKTIRVEGNDSLGGTAALSILREDTLRDTVDDLRLHSVFEVSEITGLASCGATINDNNKWQSTQTYYGGLITVTNWRGKYIKFVANQNLACIYAFLKSGVSAGNTPDYATGYTKRKIIPAGQTDIAIVPADAVYMFVYMKGGDNIFTPARMSYCEYNDERTGAVDSVCLMAYNIGHFSLGVQKNSTINASNYAEKVDGFRALLSNWKPDVYGISEYSAVFGKNTDNEDVNTKDELFNLATTVYESTQMNYACYALFANRMPVYNVAIHDFECLENETITHTSLITAQDYRYVSADLYALGLSIKLVVIHLAFDQNRPGVLQAAQLSELYTKYASSPYVIFFGDFNYNASEMAAAAAAAGYAMANDGSYKTVPSAEYGTLDNILVKGLKIAEVMMVASALSDHNPLFARITKQ